MKNKQQGINTFTSLPQSLVDAKADDQESSRQYIGPGISPHSINRLFGNVDSFSAAGVKGWLLNYVDVKNAIDVEARLDGRVVGSGKTGIERPDVSGVAQVECRPGFNITWDWGQLESSIRGYDDDDSPPIRVVTPIDPRAIISPAPPSAGQIRMWLDLNGVSPSSLTPFSMKWSRAISEMPICEPESSSQLLRGFLDRVFYCASVGKMVICGWLAGGPDVVWWLEDQEGNRYPLHELYRYFRGDVYDSVIGGIHGDITASGFIAVDDVARDPGLLKLCALAENGLHHLGECLTTDLPLAPTLAAQSLFGCASPLGDFARRVEFIDQQVIDPLIQMHMERVRELPVSAVQFGNPPLSAVVSIVVPLYGRSDFVEHQLLEFNRDAWIKQNAEIIYVVDDPRLIQCFSEEAEILYKLYDVSFRVVWNWANSGFAGANNLGVKYAGGKYLLFMNSDVIPEQPGWLQSLVDSLEVDPELGAVGPRLVFADGAIQHAGMTFRRRQDLGVWINHHPLGGMDPALDRRTSVSRVPAITGACMLMRKVDFDRVGGWSTEYLIGDFEDSDLCLKLREAGLESAYNPSVQLVHLERQSFRLLGEGDFRTRVTIYNAVRHQLTWGSMLDACSGLPKS